VVCSFVPRRRERDVATDEIRVGQHLDPRKTVGVGPYRVVNTREVNVEFRAAVFEQMRQQERHFIHRQWILARPRRLVPHLRVWRRVNWPRYEFIPGVWIDTAFSCDGAEQRVQHEETTRYGPTTANA